MGCWLLMAALVAIACAMPALAVDGAHGPVAQLLPHHTADPGLPATPAGSTAATDDLSGPPATTVFALPSPDVRHHVAAPATPPALAWRAHPRAAERGPPCLA